MVAKPHGIKGEVKAYPLFGGPEDFQSFKEVVLVDRAAGSDRLFQIDRCRLQARTAILHLAGISDRSMAEELSGMEVWVSRESLPEADKDGPRWYDLIGMKVRTENGRDLGKVRSIFATGSHDVMEIRGTGREYLIPALREFIVKLDNKAGILTIADVPGLLEINH